MEYNLITNIESCYIDIPRLLYYSHIPTGIISLLMGIFVFWKNRNLTGKLLLGIVSVFSLWLLLSLVTWISVDSQMIMLAWSIIAIMDALVFLLCFYFVYVFVYKKDLSFKFKLFLAIIVLSAILFNLKSSSGFDVPNCVPKVEGMITRAYDYYILGSDLFFTFLITLFSFLAYRKAKEEEKKQILYIALGILLFLLSFFTAVSLAGYLDKKGYPYSFEFEQYGLFGMTFFMGMLAFMIVKFKAFDIKLLGAQALVAALVILIGSMFAFVETTTNRILVGVTLALSLGAGWALVKSVKLGEKRKEELQIVSDMLSTANDQLKKLDNAKSEFISIASHQLRTPLTAIKGYISLLLEGLYGRLDARQQDILSKVYTSNERLANLVEDRMKTWHCKMAIGML